MAGGGPDKELEDCVPSRENRRQRPGSGRQQGRSNKLEGSQCGLRARYKKQDRDQVQRGPVDQVRISGPRGSHGKLLTST